MSNTFDRLAVRIAETSSRRSLLGRLAKVGAGAALAMTVATPAVRRAAAQACPYGPQTCAMGYVWREAWFGDQVCVDPTQRTQAAADNAAAWSRVDPYGPYGSLTCISGYVWRNGYNGDAVCVEPWVRDRVAQDNALAATRVQPGCA